MITKYATHFVPNIGADIYRLIEFSKALFPRTCSFLNDAFSFIENGGSLGDRFYCNDCGSIFHDSKPVAYFGFCAAGLKLYADEVEHIFGEIGLEVLNLFGFDQKPNSRLLRFRH